MLCFKFMFSLITILIHQLQILQIQGPPGPDVSARASLSAGPELAARPRVMAPTVPGPGVPGRISDRR